VIRKEPYNILYILYRNKISQLHVQKDVIVLYLIECHFKRLKDTRSYLVGGCLTLV
jgi:hypothetical protein